jgi:hypothetical protein
MATRHARRRFGTKLLPLDPRKVPEPASLDFRCLHQSCRCNAELSTTTSVFPEPMRNGRAQSPGHAVGRRASWKWLSDVERKDSLRLRRSRIVVGAVASHRCRRGSHTKYYQKAIEAISHSYGCRLNRAVRSIASTYKLILIYAVVKLAPNCLVERQWANRLHGEQ